MKIIVIGGGKVGYYLIKTLKQKKHHVTLIEKDRGLCNKVSEQLDVDVICGDATDINVLEDADIDIADVVAAVTGKDEENLVICQIAKTNFNVVHTLARVNNPKNQELFKMLGVDNTVCSTQVITNLIDWECENEKVRIIQTFEKGKMILVQVEIDRKTLWCNKCIKNLKLPKDCVIVSIFRNEHVIYPTGDTLIQEKDKVIFVTDSSNMTSSSKSSDSEIEKSLFN